ncbi:MAG: hypothetical protein WDN69_31310 [Aliidongia sp.]
MVEQIDAQIAADRDEGIGRNPAGQAPQQIVAGDQGQQHADGTPQGSVVDIVVAQRVDQGLDAVLRTDGATDRGENRDQHDEMAGEPAPDVMQEEPDGAAGRVTRERHTTLDLLPDGGIVSANRTCEPAVN